MVCQKNKVTTADKFMEPLYRIDYDKCFFLSNSFQLVSANGMHEPQPFLSQVTLWMSRKIYTQRPQIETIIYNAFMLTYNLLLEPFLRSPDYYNFV